MTLTATGCRPSHFVDVPRLDADRLDRFHREHWIPSRPIVLQGLGGDGAPSVFGWTLDHIEQACAGRELPIIANQGPYLSYERTTIPMTFAEFRERAFGDGAEPGTYYYFKNPLKMIPSLEDDSDAHPFFAEYGGRSLTRNIWIAGQDVTVGLHFDAAENLNVQVRGHKQFLLYPPGTAGYYPTSIFSQSSHVSRISRAGPNRDAGAFPRFEKITPHRALLRAGEVLYLPPFWWHEVTSLGEVNINFNYWSFPALRKQLRSPNQALRGHMGLAIRALKYGSIHKAKKAA